MGGMLAPVPVVGKPAGRITTDIATLGLAELLPSNVKDPLFNTVGSVFFSPLSGLAAGGAGLMGAGGIGAGGMGAAAPSSTAGSAGLGGLAQYTIPGAAGPTLVPTGAATGLPAGTGSMIGETAGQGAATAGSKVSGSDMLQNAFLATSVGGMLGNAIKPPPLPPASFPSAPVGGGGSFTPTSASAAQQWAQLMAQRRAQQTGKFTV